MKRLINPNRRQKLFLAEHGLKSENWKIEKETPEYLYIVSKNGQHRLLNKNKNRNRLRNRRHIIDAKRITGIQKNNAECREH